MTSDRVGIGIVGSGFIAAAHAEAFSRLPRATVRAVASRSAGRAAEFAARWGIPAWLTDFRELAGRPDVDVVCVAAPNALHRDIAVGAAAQALG
jgi:UDP-N-acetyl-2-amino-2-deoxyglucuronate dehydrogenase